MTKKEIVDKLKDLGVIVDESLPKNELENTLAEIEGAVSEKGSDEVVTKPEVKEKVVSIANKPGPDWISATPEEILAYQEKGILVGAVKGYVLIKK